MREIEFRQWQGNGFHYWGFLPTGFSGISTGNGVSVTYAKEHSQQFTGLRDKNNKKIFESDIVNLMPDGYAVVPAEVLITTRGIIYHRRDTDTSVYGADWTDVEVIGNIHQTPELLK